MTIGALREREREGEREREREGKKVGVPWNKHMVESGSDRKRAHEGEQ